MQALSDAALQDIALGSEPSPQYLDAVHQQLDIQSPEALEYSTTTFTLDVPALPKGSSRYMVWDEAVLQLWYRVSLLYEGVSSATTAVLPWYAEGAVAMPPCGYVSVIQNCSGTLNGSVGGSIPFNTDYGGAASDAHVLSVTAYHRRLVRQTRDQFKRDANLLGMAADVTAADELSGFCNGRLSALDVDYSTTAQIERNNFVTPGPDVVVHGGAKLNYGRSAVNPGMLARLVASNTAISTPSMLTSDAPYWEARFPAVAADNGNAASVTIETLQASGSRTSIVAGAVNAIATRYMTELHFPCFISMVDVHDVFRELATSKHGASITLTIAAGSFNFVHSVEGIGAAAQAIPPYCPIRLTDRCSVSRPSGNVVCGSQAVPAVAESCGRINVQGDPSVHNYTGGKGQNLGQAVVTYPDATATSVATLAGGVSALGDVILYQPPGEHRLAFPIGNTTTHIVAVASNSNNWSDRLIAVAWGCSPNRPGGSAGDRKIRLFIPTRSFANSVVADVPRQMKVLMADYRQYTGVSIGQQFAIESNKSKIYWQYALVQAFRDARASGCTPQNNAFSHTPYYGDVGLHCTQLSGMVAGDTNQANVINDSSRAGIVFDWLRGPRQFFSGGQYSHSSSLWDGEAQRMAAMGVLDFSMCQSVSASKAQGQLTVRSQIPGYEATGLARLHCYFYYNVLINDRDGVLSQDGVTPL